MNNKETSPALAPEFVRNAVEQIAAAFEQTYVDPAVAERMAEHLRTLHSEGAFAQSKSLSHFAHAVVTELRHICNDKHVFVLVRPQQGSASSENDTSCEKTMYEVHAKDNYGFRKVEILPGSIGYLDIRIFCPVSMAGNTAVAAMNFVSGTDALIVDLRNHCGGEDDMIRLLAGYLFDEVTELCTVHHRGNRGIEQSYSADFVPGPSLAKIPLYVLTSQRTFSAAEAFAYNLQQRGRAFVVGERTGGGGHTVTFVRLPELGLELGIPEGKPVNPISGTNWEGTGVVPDIQVPEEEALLTATIHALEFLKANTKDPDVLYRIDWALVATKAELEPPEVSDDTLRMYAGYYGQSNRVRVEEGVLYVQHKGYPESACTPLDTALFEYEGRSSRVQFESENGEVVTAIFTLETGERFVAQRTK